MYCLISLSFKFCVCLMRKLAGLLARYLLVMDQSYTFTHELAVVSLCASLLVYLPILFLPAEQRRVIECSPCD